MKLMKILGLFTSHPAYAEPETVEDARAISTDGGDVEGFEARQARAEIEHNETIKAQYVALRETITAEIAAIRDNRRKKAQLASAVNDAPQFMSLYAEIDHKRDDSERREAALQRQLIAVEKSIYGCDKRIARAQQKLAEM